MILVVGHETNVPHEEKAQSGGSDSGAIVIVAVVVVTLVLLAGLIWLKERTRRAEPAEPPVSDS